MLVLEQSLSRQRSAPVRSTELLRRPLCEMAFLDAACSIFCLLSWFGAYSSPCLWELARVELSSVTTKTDGKTVVFLLVQRFTSTGIPRYNTRVFVKHVLVRKLHLYQNGCADAEHKAVNGNKVLHSSRIEISILDHTSSILRVLLSYNY